jgi:hypothetical protein
LNKLEEIGKARVFLFLINQLTLIKTLKMNLKKLLLIGVLVAVGIYFVFVLILETIRLAIGAALLFLVVYLLYLNFLKKKKP